MSSDRLVRIATRPCLPTRLKRVFAPTSAHFVRRASKTSWRTCARTAAGDSFQGPSDQRRTGKATTSLARIPRAPRSGISRLTRKFMLGSRPQSKPYPLTSARARLNRRAQAVVAVAGLCGALFAFAFVAAPKSCQWGMTPISVWNRISNYAVCRAACPSYRRDDSRPRRAGAWIRGVRLHGG